jgi:hypothetical protein
VTGTEIPAAFAGTWSGTASLSTSGDSAFGIANTISFTMKADGKTAAEVNQDCQNTLTLTRVKSTVLTFNEPSNGSCVVGTVTFTLSRDGKHLAYHWAGGGALNTGTLSKKGT